MGKSESKDGQSNLISFLICNKIAAGGDIDPINTKRLLKEFEKFKRRIEGEN